MYPPPTLVVVQLIVNLPLTLILVQLLVHLPLTLVVVQLLIHLPLTPVVVQLLVHLLHAVQVGMRLCVVVQHGERVVLTHYTSRCTLNPRWGKPRLVDVLAREVFQHWQVCPGAG